MRPTELTGREIPGKVLEIFFDKETGLYRRSRYKVLHGGRGGGKSEGVARVAAQIARVEKTRFLCTRMYQNSIEDSIHRTIADAIRSMDLEHEFEILKTSITHKRTGTDFIFKGIQRDISGIKSLKGVKYCIVEEGESVPRNSWQILDPTFRENDSEIWIIYNPDLEDGATHQMFTVKPRPNSIVAEINWSDNPFFPPALNELRLAAKAEADAGDPADQATYDWIWEGKCRRLTDAVIFRSRVVVEDFDEPPKMRPFYGADWGFADDPTVLMRSYIHEDQLFITHESFEWHCEIDDIPAKVFAPIPGSDTWPIKGDAAQPMIISYLKRQGYKISAAEKWPGSVEDGIAHLKGFKRIVVHPRCKNIAQEFRLYSWKTDPRQLDEGGNPMVLPIIVDRFNHGIDAVRYSLDGYIQGKGPMKINPSAQAKAATAGQRAAMRITRSSGRR